jgi:hypothetical protein
MIPKTNIIPTEKGHTIILEIGCQSFQMSEYTSLKMAKWYKKQLDRALCNLKK